MTTIGLVLLLALVILGVPIYMAILFSSIFIISFGLGVDIWFPLSEMFDRTAVFSLLAIPMFVFLGSLLAMGGAGKSLIRVMNSFLGHIPGGPAYALVFASVIVAAMCAHPMAAIAGFGPIIVPMLIELGYSEVFAIGLLMASASLAPLIPPNTISFIYAVVANPVASETIDVTGLWTASIIPGLVMAGLLCVTVFVYSRIGHFKALPKASWSERWAALKDSVWVAVTPFTILVPLYAGWANPTEVGAIGVVYIALVCHFKYTA